MNIIKISAKIQQMTNDEIKREILSSPPIDRVLALLNESYNRKYIEAFYISSANPQVINNIDILKLTSNIIVDFPSHPASIAIVDNILEFAKNIDNSVTSKLYNASITNPNIAATVLLHHNTSISLIESIIGKLQLNVVRNSEKSKPYLDAIIEEVKKNGWNNEHSGLIMMSRIVQSPQDPFITEISQYNMAPSFAGSLINASNLYKANNPKLHKNVEQNKNVGMEIGKLAYSSELEHVSPNSIIPGLITSLQKSHYTQYAQWIWDLIKHNIKNKPEWELRSFTSQYANETIIGAILSLLPEILPELIDIIKSSKSIGVIQRTQIYEDIVNEGLSNPSYRQKTLELPYEYFQMIKMTKDNQKIVADHFNPKIEGWEEINELLSSNQNWYLRYSESKDLLKEAGWKENIATSLMAALLMIMSGSSVEAASKKTKVPESTISSALQNKELTNKAKEMQDKNKISDINNSNNSNNSDVTFDEIYSFIVNNECFKDKSGNPILALKAYMDPSKQNMAIGVGFNLDRPQSKHLIEKLGLNYQKVRSGKQSITINQAKQLFQYDSNLAQDIAKKFVNNYDKLPTKMKLVLIDMAYNMGENRLAQFKNFKKAVESFDFKKAAAELKDSEWSPQVKGRAQRSISLVAQLANESPMQIASL